MTTRRRTRRLRLAAFACVAAAVGCGSKSAPPPAPAADVWAVVDGREIRKEDVEKAYRRSVDPSAKPSEEEALTAKFSLLEDLISQDLMLADAKARGVTVTEADIDTAYADRTKNMSDGAFQKELSQRGLTPADMKEGLRRELTVQKLLAQTIDTTIQVTDQDVEKFYAANREQFHLAEPAYHIAQIVVTPVREAQITNRQNDDATTAEAAARKIQMIGERLKSGTAFSQLAMDYSEDSQSAPQGGDLGFVPASRLQQVAPPLRDAVLKTQPGAISQVSAGGAYTLVLLVEKEPAGQRDLSTAGVKESITNALKERRSQLRRSAYVANLRNDAKVINYFARQLAPALKPQAVTPAAPGRQ